MGIDARRGSERFLTAAPGRVTRHSFSFGPHYDPANLAFGPLVCHDDHLLEAGAGFPAHRHADLEIVTWVVSGALLHDGSSRLEAGRAAVQSAGAGVLHSVVAAERGTRFVQAWLRPDSPGGTPARTVAEVPLVPGRPSPVVGPDAPLQVAVAGASLAVVGLDRGQAVTVPGAPLQHLYVVTGSVAWAGGELSAGDELRVTDGRGLPVTATGEALLMAWAFGGEPAA